MKDLGTDCRDVRTREVGIQEIHHKVRPYEVCYKYEDITRSKVITPGAIVLDLTLHNFLFFILCPEKEGIN